MKNKSYQIGFGLLEIMIALTIGAFLLGGVLQIFSNGRQTNKSQEGLSRLQESGRFALDLLTRDIRTAGYIGCNSVVPITNTLNNPAAFLYNFAQAIEGFEATTAAAWTPAINAEVTAPRVGGSDIITIRRAETQNFTVTTHAATTDPLTLDVTATLANLIDAGYIDAPNTNKCITAIVSNCKAAAVFQPSAIAARTLTHAAVASNATCASGEPGNQTANLGSTFQNAQVFPINTVSYFVRNGPRGRPSLYRRIGSGNAQEMVEGIEQMQILYGVDNDATRDGAANTYLTANTVADMTRVVSVRISILASTVDDNVADQPTTIFYNGANLNSGDRRLRRVFTTTIALRNRLHLR